MDLEVTNKKGLKQVIGPVQIAMISSMNLDQVVGNARLRNRWGLKEMEEMEEITTVNQLADLEIGLAQNARIMFMLLVQIAVSVTLLSQKMLKLQPALFLNCLEATGDAQSVLITFMLLAMHVGNVILRNRKHNRITNLSFIKLYWL